MSLSCLHVLNNERGLDTYPSVYNAMYVLASHGWINCIATAGDIGGFAKLITRDYPLRGGYLRHAWQLARIVEKFDMVVVYEPRDVEIYRLAKIMGSKFRPSTLVHHCLEVPTSILHQPGLRQFVHRILYQGYHDFDWILIQDESRKKLFQNYFPRIQQPRYAEIPNSYMVDIEPVAQVLPWFDDLRKASRCLITYTGAIERWAISSEFMKVVAERKDISFLLSGWSQDGFVEQLMSDCREADHIHFDLGKKNRDELNYIVSKSDMGMIFYDSIDPNVSEIGLTSGKLHKFLSYNKPVLANRMPALEGFLGDNGFGLSVEPAFMSNAIDCILRDLDGYRTRIKDNYSKMCDYRNAYRLFLGQIEE